jgi:hypothetical protein
MVKSFIRGLSKWPSADLAELLLAIQRILHDRAEHNKASKADKPKVPRKTS